MDADPAWRAFHAAASPAVASRASELPPRRGVFRRRRRRGRAADAVRLATRAASVPEAAGSNPGAGRGVFEVRTYQLELGYNPIPKLVAHMTEGLPSKLASDPNRVGRLVGMFYSGVGAQQIEVWRYPSFQDHIRVREAARTAEKWRETIGAIAPMGADVRHETVRPDGELLASEREGDGRGRFVAFQCESERAIVLIVTCIVPSMLRDAPRRVVYARDED